jgi:hypothetical protein
MIFKRILFPLIAGFQFSPHFGVILNSNLLFLSHIRQKWGALQETTKKKKTVFWNSASHWAALVLTSTSGLLSASIAWHTVSTLFVSILLLFLLRLLHTLETSEICWNCKKNGQSAIFAEIMCVS